MIDKILKEEAHKMIEELPENATWDDLMYKIYVRQSIDSGLKDSDSGNTISVEEIRLKFGLKN